MNELSPIRSFAGVAGVAALLVTSPASASAPASKIWVDVRPWTCAGELGPFARHVQLACDSLGGACEVATSPKQADFRASLACGEPESWSLVLQKSDGAEVLSLALEGDREQRLRKAAVWVAHASVGEPPPRRARPSAARPEPEEPPPAALPVAPSPAPRAAKPRAVVIPVAPPPEAPEAPEAPDAEPEAEAPPAVQIVVPSPAAAAKPEVADDERRGGGLTVSGLGGVSSRRDVIAGARATFAFPLGAGFALAPTVNFARSVGRDDGGNLLLGGAMLGWGAPFGGRWLGFSIEGGAGASLGGEGGRGGHGEDARPSLYGRVAGTLQIPVDFPVRPFVSIAGTHVSNQLGQPAQTALLDVGFAWRAF